LRKTDALEMDFTFAPEFDQTAGALPDAFMMRKRLPDLVGEDASMAGTQTVGFPLEFDYSIRHAAPAGDYSETAIRPIE
jgi:hypothetical protein